MNFNNKHAHVPLLNTINCSYLCVYYANAKEFLIVFFSPLSLFPMHIAEMCTLSQNIHAKN